MFNSSMFQSSDLRANSSFTKPLLPIDMFCSDVLWEFRACNSVPTMAHSSHIPFFQPICCPIT